MTVSESTPIEAPDEDVIVEIENVSVSFGMERGQARVLNDVSLEIHRNEILGVIGESGSGKSMLASALLNAVVSPGVLSGDITYYPKSGEPISVTDLSSTELKQFRWEEAAMVFQGAMSSFNPVRTIRDHFIETLSAHDASIDEGMARAEELLSDLHMSSGRVLDSYPHELSGGMQQRTLIALSLVLEPEMLVMDEPTAALDLLMQQSIIELIENIQEEYDLTIVFITHDLPLVAGLADRLGVLYAFEFAELGPAYELLTEPAHPYTQALLQSTPNLSDSLDKMQPIAGESPDPVNIPSGCSYHSRCRYADEQCEEIDPPLEPMRSIGEPHSVACHYWEEVKENPLGQIEDDDRPATQSSTGDPDRGGEPLLSLENIEVHFEGDSPGFFSDEEPDTVRAVDDVSLEMHENDVVVLVGESGCGKTTLGKTGVGLQRPTSGHVRYRGQDYWQAYDLLGDISVPWEDIRRELQIIHQDPGSSLNSYRRVRSILEAPLKRWHPELDGNDRTQRILGMLEYVGMSPPEDYIERYPHQLSGGEKQRIALIRAMLIDPDVILADEAVSALDVSLRVEMMDLMIELQKQFGTSFLFISHNLSNARYLAQKMGGRIAVMYLGKIVEIGPPEQIIEDPTHPYTEALKWATPDLDPDVAVETRDRPIRTIDIPDPANVPTGCRYHTRCPEAREVCKRQEPELETVDGDDGGQSACFRAEEEHEYWNSEPIDDGP